MPDIHTFSVRLLFPFPLPEGWGDRWLGLNLNYEIYSDSTGVAVAVVGAPWLSLGHFSSGGLTGKRRQ